ncbi:MAG: TetR/AcrR family transcriptional regulator [Candidatus Izimaplasma sp.]|nr:TetR/AcrR family transcriptional regulator [Candidatus Izimaplasma bacterium]
MNKRELSKYKTRENILEKTEVLLQKKGYLKVSTREIADVCSISQGSIFLHFESKNQLFDHILESSIENILKNLKIINEEILDSDEFLKRLFNVLIKFEGILSRTFKDYDYLNDKLKQEIDELEVSLKDLIFEHFKSNDTIELGIMDSFVVIDAFISQIIVTLMNKSTYSKSSSVIRDRRGKLRKLFNIITINKKKT